MSFRASSSYRITHGFVDVRRTRSIKRTGHLLVRSRRLGRERAITGFVDQNLDPNILATAAVKITSLSISDTLEVAKAASVHSFIWPEFLRTSANNTGTRQ